MMIEKNAVLPVRELYCLAHAGNSYYVAEQREMQGIPKEARYWGFVARTCPNALILLQTMSWDLFR